MIQNAENNVTSFHNVGPSGLDSLDKIDEQASVVKSHYQESWSVAWSPDSSYVAWSQGGGIVYLLPWDKKEERLSKRPVINRSNDDLSNFASEDSSFLENLPRIMPHNNDESTMDDDDTNTNRVSWNLCCEDESFNSVEEIKITEKIPDKPCFRIDCMNIVWSLAFGRGMSSDNNNKVWRRFKFKEDLILATGLQNGKIKLWHVYSGNLLMELLDHKGIVRNLSFTVDGSLKLVSCSNDCTIKFWDLHDDGNMYKTLRFETNSMVFSCKWSPNCKQVAAVGMNKNACVWDVTDFNTYKKLIGHLNVVCSCDFSPDGALLATASFDTRVIIWDPYTGDQVYSLGHLFPPPRPIYAGGCNEHYVRDISFSRNGQNIATVCDDRYIRVWNLKTFTENPECIAVSENPLCCAYNASGQILATGNVKGTITFHKQKANICQLKHLSRMATRQNLTTQLVDRLHFPFRLKEYLKYKSS